VPSSGVCGRLVAGNSGLNDLGEELDPKREMGKRFKRPCGVKPEFGLIIAQVFAQVGNEPIKAALPIPYSGSRIIWIRVPLLGRVVRPDTGVGVHRPVSLRRGIYMMDVFGLFL